MCRRFILGSLIVIMGFVGDSKALSLSEAMNSFYQKNNQVQEENEKWKESRAAFAGATLNLLPDIRYSKSLAQNVTFYTLNDTKFDQEINKNRSVLSGQINFSITGTMLDPIRASQMVQIQKLSFAINLQNLTLQAIAAYLDVIRDTKILQAAVNNEKVLRQYNGFVNKRAALGEATKTDIEQSEARLASAMSAKIQANGGLVVSKAAFSRVFGIESENLSMPKRLSELPSSLEKFNEMATNQNMEIQASYLNNKIAKIDIGRAVGNIAPTISASVSRIKNDDNMLNSGVKEQRVSSVEMSIPILPRGGAEIARVVQSKYSANRVAFEYENAKLILRQQILEAWNNLKTSEANIEAAKATLEFTTMAMDSIRKEALYGSRTILDVLNTDLENFNAEVALIRVQYNLIMSHYKMLAILGKLNIEIFDYK